MRSMTSITLMRVDLDHPMLGGRNETPAGVYSREYLETGCKMGKVQWQSLRDRPPAF
jgi:hypothetical protein